MSGAPDGPLWTAEALGEGHHEAPASLLALTRPVHLNNRAPLPGNRRKVSR